MTHIPDEAMQEAMDATYGSIPPIILEKALRAALPYLSAPCAVEVKKLEWVAGDGISATKSYYEAKANGLTYCVIDGQCWIESLGISIQKIGTDKEAKAASQADFERRILSCVVTKTAAMPTKEERHANTARNLIINQTSTDLENIINGHDPEQSILNNDVWDRLVTFDVAAARRQAFEEGFENGVEQSLNALDAYDDITRKEAEQAISKLKPDYRALSHELVS